MSVHRDAVTRATKRRAHGWPARPRNGPVKVTRVNRSVWRAALRLAGGDQARLTVIDADTVIVANFARRVRRELHQAADQIEPGDDGLERIRMRLRSNDREIGVLSKPIKLDSGVGTSHN